MPPRYEYVAFIPRDADALDRLRLLIAAVQEAKANAGTRGRLDITASAYLTDEDRARFWRPTPEEEAEAMEDWWAAPVETRPRDPYLQTPWRLSAALSVTLDCEYSLIDVVPVGDRHHVRFQTHGFPYGGTDSLIALIEGLGHKVTGENDGTGYQDYVPVQRLWTSKRKWPA